MKKIITYSLFTIFILTLIPQSYSQEKGISEYNFYVAPDIKSQLLKNPNIAIFFTGNNGFITKIMEDAFAISLSNVNFMLINREVLEKSVGEQITKLKKEKDEGSINALEIGKIVKAGSILTGTVYSNDFEKQTIQVKIASFQLIDVESGKTLMNILFEFETTKSCLGIAEFFITILKQNM